MNKKKTKKKLPSNGNQGLTIGVFLLITLGLFVVWSKFESPATVVEYSKFFQQLENDNIESISIQGQKIEGIYTSKNTNVVKNFLTIMPMNDPMLLPLLKEKNILTKGKIVQSSGASSSFWWILIVSAGVLMLWSSFSKGGGGGPGQAMNFGKTKARLHSDTGEKKM